jgi:pimeloyl-ACP methyl ester carboxylesterase
MLWHELAGDGPPVLLLHEGICDSRVWEPQWRTFPLAHRTVRCDLRGFGRTPLPLSRSRTRATSSSCVDRLVLAFLDEE